MAPFLYKLLQTAKLVYQKQHINLASNRLHKIGTWRIF